MTLSARTFAPIVALLAGFAPAAAAPTDASALRAIRSDLARVCARKAGNLEITFKDSDDTHNTAIVTKGNIYVYRYGMPESLDWSVSDNYIFSGKDGARLHFSRSMQFAGHNYSYVLTIDRQNHRVDNVAALPDGIYLTDEPILKNLKQFCRSQPVAAE
jgi:hypothetical protein